MAFSEKTSEEDTSSQFNANVDRLIMLINTTLQRKQVESAERYLKYLFEVMVRYFQKTAFSKPGRLRSFAGLQISPEADTGQNQSLPKSSFSNRTISSNYRDPFQDKIAS